MDNDEKMAPHGEDTLLPNGDEPSFESPKDSGDAAQAEASAGVKSAKTLPFPGPKSDPAPVSLDASFGMPDFGFFADPPVKHHDPKPQPVREVIAAPAEPVLEVVAMPEDTNSEAEPVPPLKEGTGWETVGSIMKSSSLRARIEAQDVSDELIGQLFANDDEIPEPAEAEKPAPATSPVRSDANVTPFPGPVVQRPAERAPSELLRAGGGGSADVFDDISARAGDEQALPSVLEPPANPDALADAVQSALRNIYGSFPEAPEDRTDLSGFTVADALAGADNAPEDAPSWPAEERNLAEEWPQRSVARARDYDEPLDEAEESNPEPVLDYFYAQQRRQERPAVAPQLSSEMSLNDYAARSSREEKWRHEEPEEETQRVMPFPARDRSQPVFHARGGELSATGEMNHSRGGGGFRDAPMRPTLETEWGQPTYGGAPPQNARGSITPTYAPAIATPADTIAAPQGPDSGHLLGAAGLGLIGGIALAGVLAVFVFNSFVDESGQNGQDNGPKVVERLAPALATSNPLEGRVSLDGRPVEAPASTQSAPPQAEPAVEPQRQAALSAPPAPVETVKPKLSAGSVAGAPDTPIRLNIAIGDVDTGDALVSLKGLPKDARLSTGIDVGGGQWLLPPGRLKDLTLSAPSSAAGNHGLEAQLLKDDAQTSISEPVPFTLSIGAPTKLAASTQAGSGTTAAPQRNDASRLAVLPDEAPLPETDFLTQMLIRDGNKKMREGDIASARRLYEQAAASGNAEAALAMGRSYDPTYFEKLNVRTGKPDPATAFEWYKKALDGGLVTAKVKIDALKQWLQR